MMDIGGWHLFESHCGSVRNLVRQRRRLTLLVQGRSTIAGTRVEVMIGGGEEVWVNDTKGALEVLSLIRIKDWKVVMINGCLVVVIWASI